MTPQEMERILPPSMRHLPRDKRGIPVPWFVAQIPGQEVDLRIADGDKRRLGYDESLCWVCGVKLGKNRVFVMGPLGVANRASSEWCCHERCAEFSSRCCPALNGEMGRRPKKEYPPDAEAAPGTVDTLPGVFAHYYAGGVRVASNGLFLLGPPRRVVWWGDGRHLAGKEALDRIQLALAPHGFDAKDALQVFKGEAS